MTSWGERTEPCVLEVENLEVVYDRVMRVLESFQPLRRTPDDKVAGSDVV
jgi:hypothetical protein